MPATSLTPAEKRATLRERADRLARLRRRVAATGLATFVLAVGAVASLGSMGAAATTTQTTTAVESAAVVPSTSEDDAATAADDTAAAPDDDVVTTQQS